MPMLKLSSLTMQLVRSRRPPGFELSGHLPRLDDGSWLVAISDQVLMAIVEARVRGESDDGVVSRMLRQHQNSWPSTIQGFVKGATRRPS